MITINDLTPLGIATNSKVLAIFPHPDDESAYAGGLLQRIVHTAAQLTLMTLTDGERSTLRHGLGFSEDLATVRRQELADACGVLGITNYQYAHFPDGAIAESTPQITTYIAEQITLLKPTHILVMEPVGIYGHPDHIASSQIVTELVQQQHSDIKLIYITVDSNYYIPSENAKRVAVSNHETLHPQSPDYKFELTREEQSNKLVCFQKYRSQFIVDEAFIQKWQQRTLLKFEYLAVPE